MKRKKTRAQKDQGVQVEMLGNRIVISVGISVIAFAAHEHLELYDGENDRKLYKITNERVFAKEVLIALQDEREDGSSVLSDLFDAACLKAIEDGAQGVEEIK